MEKILVADMGVEAGGMTSYGSQSEGVWLFWTEGTTIDFAASGDVIIYEQVHYNGCSGLRKGHSG